MSEVLRVGGLTVRYGETLAVTNASLTVSAGHVFGLIGETASGKTSLASAIARLLPPSARVDGQVWIDDVEILGLDRRDFRALRGSTIGYIPQDAMAALNPVMRVGRQIAEVYETHEDGARTADPPDRRALEQLRRVRIQDVETVARLYPHELSGGMRQRVMIAIALAMHPPLVIADEPTTALDVSSQAEIIRLVAQLSRELGLAVLWITHDLGVVAELADDVGVMYAGRLVEVAPIDEIFSDPRHPYTAGLLETLRSLRGGEPGERMFQIAGQPPASAAEATGCPFAPRCPRAIEVCTATDPPPVTDGRRTVACHAPLPGGAT